MLKRAIVCMGVLFLAPCLLPAGESLFSGYCEAGKRTTSEDFDEEESDDEYTYRNYYLKYIGQTKDHRPNAGRCIRQGEGAETKDQKNNFRYELSTFQKVRDYMDIDALDNWSSVYKGKCSYDFKEGKIKTLQSGIALKHKAKRFDDFLLNEYDQMRVVPYLTKAEEGRFRLTMTGGWDQYEYAHAGHKDQKTWFGRIRGNRFCFDKKLKLDGAYHAAKTVRKRVFKKRLKQEGMAKVEYKLNQAYLDKALVRVNAGQRDTKEEDVQDIDYDYRFLRVFGKTYHAWGKKTFFDFSYQYFEKNYLFYNRDHTGYWLHHRWKHLLRDNKARSVWAACVVEYKRASFPLVSGYGYQKKSLAVKAVYRRKKNWAGTLLAGTHHYDFRDDQRDKNDFTVSLVWDKKLKEGRLDLVLKGTYRHTDYKNKNNTTRMSARMGFGYKF